MTKYILHGGETGVPNEDNKLFYQEWIKDFKVDIVPTILLVYFSRPKEDWGKLEEQDKERFAKYTENHLVKFIVADSEWKTFENQIKEADVIYVRGGSSDLLIEVLAPIKDSLLKAIDNKVYAGSSAGVMALSHFTRSNTSDWKEGLGLIPINSIVHWSDELKEDLIDFKNSHLDSTHEYVLIPETEFIIKYF